MLKRRLITSICVPLSFTAAFAYDAPFLANLNQIRHVGTTVPGNGDVNPYGVAIVPRSIAALVAGDVLISNFNDSANLQGTGTTIDEIGPQGNIKVFAQINASSVRGCVGGVGLTTGLVVLRSGWVIVGSLPTTDGTAATAQAGCLIVLNAHGQVVETFAGNGINGPWDMTAADFGTSAVLFVSNVLFATVPANGAIVHHGTVLRILLSLGDGNSTIPADTPRIVSLTVVASTFEERTDPAALVIGPTGLGLGHDGTLYIADTLENRIAAVPQALTRLTNAGLGNTLSQGGALNGPLGITIAPNGDILAVNGGDGNIVEISPAGAQLVVKNIDTTNTGAGTLFGLAIAPGGQGVYFVNDGNNTLNLLH
jgi:DNA-binding beta-propeller fold protein YncE